MFIDESIPRSIAKFTTEETVRRGDIDFSLSLNELESFIAQRYAKELYKKNTLLYFCGTRGTEFPFSMKRSKEQIYKNIKESAI